MSRVKKLMRKAVEPIKRKKAKATSTAEKTESPIDTHKVVKMLPDGDHMASVVSALDRKPERVRIGGEWIHVSYLVAGDCLRAMQLARHLELSAIKKPMAADRILWAIGKAVEKHIRDTVIAATGKHNVFGRWSCVCKSLQYEGLGDDRECCRCGEQANEYSEYLVQDTSMMLSGSPDLLIKVGGTKDDPVLMVVEIKSIKVVPKGGVRTSAADFHNLEAPSRTHSLQALLYHGLLRRNGFKVVDNVVVFYAAKDYVTCNPYKPFNVDATEQHNSFSVDALFGMATDYAQMDGTGELLPRLSSCSSTSCSKVKNCPVGAHCFAIKNNKLGTKQ